MACAFEVASRDIAGVKAALDGEAWLTPVPLSTLVPGAAVTSADATDRVINPEPSQAVSEHVELLVSLKGL